MFMAVPHQTARLTLCAAAACALACTGCHQMPTWRQRAELKAVNGFASALQQDDATALRASTSPAFGATALRDDNAVEDLKRLWPAKGKLEVVVLKDVPEADRHNASVPEKLVTVKDEQGWKTDQRLVKDPKSGHWQVDEVFVSQKSKGIKATRSVTEQVAFLATIRDFETAWRSGTRDARLAGVTDDCRAELGPLPEPVLNHLASRMFPAEGKPAVPDATLDDDLAAVRLRRATGAVMLNMKRIDGVWLVDDVALEDGKSKDHIPSLRKTAIAYGTAVQFLTAYAAADQPALQAVAATRFYDETLKSADLKAVTLPAPDAARDGALKVGGRQAELVIKDTDAAGAERTVRLNLVRTDDENAARAVTEFRVEDVAFFEDEGRVQKRLASLLVAEPLTQLYADALVARDIARLRVMATNDFREKVWRKIPEESAQALPLTEVAAGDRRVLSTVYKGAITEVTIMQHDRAMTLVLKDEDGAVRVDDVLLAVANRPSSLKTTLVSLLPVFRFTQALAASDVDAVRDACTADFNRLIWAQVRTLPPAALGAQRFLDAPLSELDVREGTATVRLGDVGYGSIVSLVEEQGRLRVHDVTIVAGPTPAEQASLKPLLRDQIANGTLFANVRPNGGSAEPVRLLDNEAAPVQTASRPAASLDGGIMQVGYEVPADEPVPHTAAKPPGASEALPLPDQEGEPSGDLSPLGGVAGPFSESLR